MIYQHHYTNNFLDFSRGQHLHPIYRVVLSLFFWWWDWNSFSSPFLRVAHLEPKGALPY